LYIGLIINTTQF